MAESFPDSDRPLQPPIDRLEQIKSLPGASAQAWPIAFMTRTLPLTRRVMIRRLSRSDNDHSGRALRTALAADLLLDRILLSLQELSAVMKQEKQGANFVSGKPIYKRGFTFAEITYLSASSMVELGMDSNHLIQPDESMRAEAEQEMLFAGPAVCDAFNGAIAHLRMPAQRRAGIRSTLTGLVARPNMPPEAPAG